jgi:hypothetical protein
MANLTKEKPSKNVQWPDPRPTRSLKGDKLTGKSDRSTLYEARKEISEAYENAISPPKSDLDRLVRSILRYKKYD